MTSGLIGAAGGFVGGAGGYTLSYFLDQPAIRWQFKSALLFGIVFSLLIASVLGFASLQFIIANPAAHNIYIFVLSVISSFVSSGFSGVLNNLRLTR